MALFTVLICISLLIGNKSFSDELYDLMADGFDGNLVEYKNFNIVEDIKLAEFEICEKRVSLIYDSIMEDGETVNREILLQVPEGFVETNQKYPSICGIDFEGSSFIVGIEDGFGPCIDFALESIKMKMDDKGVKYEGQWFDAVESMFSSNTDETIFIESLLVGSEDIKKNADVGALHKAALCYGILLFNGMGEPYVIYDSVNSLYYFPILKDDDKCFVKWVLYKDQNYFCSGGLKYQCQHNGDRRFFDEAAGYLKRMLWLELHEDSPR